MKEGLIIIYRAACKKPDSGFFVWLPIKKKIF
jgi:hypothetical protein